MVQYTHNIIIPQTFHWHIICDQVERMFGQRQPCIETMGTISCTRFHPDGQRKELHISMCDCVVWYCMVHHTHTQTDRHTHRQIDTQTDTTTTQAKITNDSKSHDTTYTLVSSQRLTSSFIQYTTRKQQSTSLSNVNSTV